jgi:hypothetical protein
VGRSARVGNERPLGHQARKDQAGQLGRGGGWRSPWLLHSRRERGSLPVPLAVYVFDEAFSRDVRRRVTTSPLRLRHPWVGAMKKRSGARTYETWARGGLAWGMHSQSGKRQREGPGPNCRRATTRPASQPGPLRGINRLAPRWPRGVPRDDARGRVVRRSKSAGRCYFHPHRSRWRIHLENPLKVETRVEMPGSRRHAATARPGTLFADMSLKKSAQRSRTPQSRYGRASNAGPARDTCRRNPNRKPSNRPLTCGFSRGAGRT